MPKGHGRCRCGQLLGADGRESFFFFQIMLGDFASKLHIPPKFTPRIDLQGAVQTMASLSSCMAWSWKVTIWRGRDGNVFMDDGWPEFVRYHSIKKGDFLLFRYSGKLNFFVKVFDVTACESSRDVRRRNPQAFCCEQTSVGLPSPIPSEESEEEATEVDSGQSSEGEEEDDDGSEGSQATNHATTLPRGRVDSNGCKLPRIFKACYISRRRPITQAERTRAFAKATSFMQLSQHINPQQCFVTAMGATCVYKRFYLSVPMDFANRFRLQHISDVELCLPENMEQYKARLTETCRGRCRLTGGWGYFALGNNLEEGDVCVFEITKVDSKKRKCAFNVHIFRVVDELTPLRLHP